MHRFVGGEIDVLVSTLIVESGLDVPNANTMFVNRADHLGLAQLYQLRGRVGRSHRRAYCYLLVPDSVDTAANREMKQIVRTYYRDASFGYFASLGYASARLVTDLIRQAFAAGGSLTRPGLLKAATAIGSYGCHGLCKDVNLTPPLRTHGGNHNVWIVRAKGGKWVLEAGPIDAWRTPTWPRPGQP